MHRTLVLGPVLALTALGALAPPLVSQVLPGQYLACVRAPAGEMWLCDPATRGATQLTIPAFLQTDWANCIWMDTPVTGFIGTFNNPNLYSIVVTGTTVTTTLLTTSPMTLEITQLTRIGNFLYASQHDKLWKVPVAGGAPVQVLDMLTLPGWPAGGLCNALAGDGISKIYLCIWTTGQIYAFDTITTNATLMLTLPNSKLSGTWLVVHAQMKFPAPLGILAVVSTNGDLAIIDTMTSTLTHHYYQASGTSSKDSLFELMDSGDWAIGTRDGAIDVLVPVGTDGHLARRDIDNVSVLAARVVAIWYNNAGARYTTFGPGCAGSGANIPTSVGRGPAVPGNASFGFGIDTVNGTGNAALILGTNRTGPYPIDLTPLGAPGCFLHHDAPIVIGVATTGTGPGLGWGTLKVPLPNITGTVLTQWASLDAAANTLGIAMSNARELKL